MLTVKARKVTNRSRHRGTPRNVKVAETEVDVRTFTKADQGQPNVPISGVNEWAQVAYWSRTLQDCLAVKACISYTAWGFGDKYSWVPGVFKGEGAALIYDENLQPKQQFCVLQQNLELAKGAPHRTGRGARRS